jgi:hypothetical protein
LTSGAKPLWTKQHIARPRRLRRKTNKKLA